MLYRITNDIKPPRGHVVYDTASRAVLIESGKSITVDLDRTSAEFVHERAIAGVGPKIERLGKIETEDTGEDVMGENVMGEPRPIARRRQRPRRRPKKKAPVESAPVNP